MNGLTDQEEAEVRNLIRYPWGLDITRHRDQTKNWTLAMFDFGEALIKAACPQPEIAFEALTEWRELRAERSQILMEEAAIRRDAESLEVGKKTLCWTRWATCLTIAVVFLTVALVILAIVDFVCR
jgi:hypothetical protein